MIPTVAGRGRTTQSWPTITDAGIYPPPTTGTYAYNADVRPALGASYRIASGWWAFRCEVFAINVVTGAFKRFCHHRTREIETGGYYSSPRASCAADGSFIVFASNMNDSTPTGYADLYGIANPLS